MEDDPADLVRQLLTRAGTILEDASAVAIMIVNKTPDELWSICHLLQAQNQSVAALLAAAATLAEEALPKA